MAGGKIRILCWQHDWGVATVWAWQSEKSACYV